MGLAVNQTALDNVLLLRVGLGGCTTAALLRDLAPFVSHVLSPAAWRELAEARLAELKAAGHVTPVGRTKLELTPRGLRAAGLKRGRDADHWPHVRDTVLTAKALGVPVGAKAAEGLVKADALRIAVVQRGFGEPIRATEPAKLRKKLKVIAATRPLDARQQAAMTDISDDKALMAALAAEFVGTTDRDAINLRRRLIRTFLAPYGAIPTSTPIAVQPLAPVIATPALLPEGLPAVPLPTQVSPDLPRFAATVRKLAEINATGWSGNRRAYISHVYNAVKATEPHWELNETNFKTLLTAAHRGGHLELVNADLKDRSSGRELEASATAYKNSVWHLIRVGET
jgi:hypothetical protein